MRRFSAILLLLLCCSPFVYGQKTRFGQVTEKPSQSDYTIKVHLSATQIRHYCKGFGDGVSCGEGLYAETILNGKKIELSGSSRIAKNNHTLIVPGDYPARLTKDIHNADSTTISQEYDLLLSDGTVWHCVTTGISE
jgi:hypothetical protein